MGDRDIKDDFFRTFTILVFLGVVAGVVIITMPFWIPCAFLSVFIVVGRRGWKKFFK